MIHKPQRKTIYITVAVIAMVILVGLVIIANLPPSKTSNKESSSSTQTEQSNGQGDDENSVTYSNQQTGGSVDSSVINNLNSTITNVPESEITSINRMLGYTLSLNGVDHKVTDVTIRPNTYHQSLIDTNRIIYQSTFMIDIPSLKQSYYVKDLYSPLPVEQSGLSDYTVQITCPDSSQLIYPPFDCVDRISYEQTGVKK